jgi:hypothetical protein
MAVEVGPHYFSLDYDIMLIVEVEVNLRPTVSRPVCFGVRCPSGTLDPFFFLLEIFFRQLRVCYFVAPSLTRGRVCNLPYNCFWALPEQSLLGRSPAELMAIFHCLIWSSSNLEIQVPIFISSRNRVAQLYPWVLGSLFVASYDSQGNSGGILTRLQTGLCWWVGTEVGVYSSQMLVTSFQITLHCNPDHTSIWC